MVRFKNRYLLVEFLQPSLLAPATLAATALPDLQGGVNADSDLDDDDEYDDELVPAPSIPFLVPLPLVNGDSSRPKLSDDSGGAIFRAVRGCVQDVFGDEGWGRVASSFKVIYHSPLTTLTIIRVARPHLRTLWAALTLITSLSGQAVLPRVVAVSGTIRKLQTRAVSYHRLVVGQIVAVSAGDEARRQLQEEGEKERGAMEGVVE